MSFNNRQKQISNKFAIDIHSPQRVNVFCDLPNPATVSPEFSLP